MTVEEQKTIFAIELLRFPGEHLRAATSVLGELHPIQGRMQLADLWRTDPFVLDTCKDLLERYGEEHFLPTKSDVARIIFKRATGPNIDAENFGKLMKLYAEVRGFIERPKNGDAPATNIGTMNVLVVKDKGTTEQWQTSLIDQQRKLIEDASTAIAIQ
ncbi:MAG: hypothetical protein WAN50_00350 [Minisyncoccia bacterium]